MIENQPIEYYRYRHSGWEKVDAGVIRETPVTLTVNGEVWLTFLCTPSRLEELAAGFLFNEGVIQSKKEIASVHACENCNIDIWLNRSVNKPAHWQRTSGCSGGATNPTAHAKPLPVGSEALLDPQSIFFLMNQLLHRQDLYQSVRGVHCSALSDGKQILVLAEDIGRHNTLDKIAGILLMHEDSIENPVVLTTGRISSEMLQKSSRLGARIVISRTSPSSLSIQFAHDLGITLVGYARQTQFNVYTHPQRLGQPDGKIQASPAAD